MSESRTQLPARRPVDGVEVSGCGTRSATLQPQRAGTLAAPIGQRHRCFGRSLCGARSGRQPGNGLPVFIVALLRRGAALRCAAAAVGTVASIRRYWLPLCGRGTSLVEVSRPAQMTKGTAHSIATSPRARAPSAKTRGENGPWGEERLPHGHTHNPHDPIFAS